MPRRAPLPRRYPCPRDCGYLTMRANFPCCLNCVWHATQAPGFPRHSDFCERQTAAARQAPRPVQDPIPCYDGQPLSRVLLALLARYDTDVPIAELWAALGDQWSYGTLQVTLRRLCLRQLVVRVAWGRYLLSRRGRQAAHPGGPHTPRLESRRQRWRRFPCSRGCGRLTARPPHPCCQPCFWHALDATNVPRHSRYCDAQHQKATALGGPHAP